MTTHLVAISSLTIQMYDYQNWFDLRPRELSATVTKAPPHDLRTSPPRKPNSEYAFTGAHEGII